MKQHLSKSEFYKPSGQLAFGFEINGKRTETTVFIDAKDYIDKMPHNG